MQRVVYLVKMGVGVVGGNNRTPYLLGWRSKGVVEAYNRVGDGLKKKKCMLPHIVSTREREFWILEIIDEMNECVNLDLFCCCC